MQFCPGCLGHGRIPMECSADHPEPHRFAGGATDRPEPGTYRHWFAPCTLCDGSGMRSSNGRTGLPMIDGRPDATRHRSPSYPEVCGLHIA